MGFQPNMLVEEDYGRADWNERRRFGRVVKDHPISGRVTVRWIGRFGDPEGPVIMDAYYEGFKTVVKGDSLAPPSIQAIKVVKAAEEQIDA